jgi:hypothetical protein
MVDIAKWVRYETKSGEPIRAGGVTVTPHSGVLTVHWPNGAWVWNRPLAITVEEGNFSHRQPITDTTRQSQWILLGLALLFILKGIARR